MTRFDAVTSGGQAHPGNLALYRKYRSATFAEVIGQDHVTEPLRQALAAKRINHAYLFSGPRGCGKTSSARILARSLNCVQGPTPEPCGVCDSCKELAPNGPGSIDVIEIDAASHGGVDDARDLRERAFFAPVRDRYKVYIIDEAHMVTTQGFNALLKLVEEPPDFLVFIFATTEPDKVLTTIRSRTHHYPFRLIPPAAMRANLEAICAAEQITVEPAVLPLVVRAGGGSARDSQSILDQLLAGAGPDGVTYASAVALLGVTDASLLDDMVDALAAGDAAAVYGTVDRVAEAGHDPRRFSVDLLERFRDLILLGAVPDAVERGLIDVPGDEATRMADQVLRLGPATLTRYAEIVHLALIEMRGTTSPRLVLELLCARMMLPDAHADAAALLQRLERLERRMSAAGQTIEQPLPPAQEAPPAPRAAEPPIQSPPTPPASPTPSAQEAPPAQETPAQDRQVVATPPPSDSPTPPDDATVQSGTARAAATQAAPSRPASTQTPPAHDAPADPADPAALDGAALRRLWPETLEVVKQTSRRTRALLDNAQITDVDGSTVHLSAPGAQAKMSAEDSNTGALRAALTQVVGGEWSVVVDGAAAPPGAPARSGAPSAPAPPAAREPEPDPRDDGDFEPSADAAAAQRADPEAEAIKLLTSELGARPLDG
ncbi:DNA polymerase III subunit gamma and tau [uncultured Jatrophihabitans sp.]|uniref:DNA polymerase III subunit gamma and tau n=1 Tax=uncultured Jatrophihabitans sp. TaxID=1610747 RepID=UPI0035CA354D